MASLLSIDHLRFAGAAVWALVCLSLVFPAVRALAWRDRSGDAWKAVTFFCGLLFTAFPSRSIVRPGDDVTRQWLYVLSILLALYVLVLEYQDWREGRG